MENPVPQKDIIIKCSLGDMVKHFFKDNVILWHDPNLNSQENQQFMSQLQRLCEIQSFTEWEKASSYIQQTNKVCHVITSGTNGEAFVKDICSNESVCKINVFCRNKDYHSTWAKTYPEKSFCVETKMEDVFDKMEQNLLEWYKQESSLKLNPPAFAPIWNDVHKSQMNNLHRYLKIIPNFKNREQAKNDFADLSREIYSDKKYRNDVAEFLQNYTEYHMESILEWYTRESFLYKVTNNCLRIATSDSIQYCRLPLKDMQEAIKEQYQKKSKNFNGLLYTIAPLGEEEWQTLKDNMGREIEMNGFLSTSKDKDVALKYADFDSIEKVFITIIVPKGPNDEEQGFAEVEDFSRYPQEKEVLFNVRSRFTILETEDKSSEERPCRHLVLLYGAQGFRRFVTEKNPVREISVPENISCVRCKAPSSEIDGKILFTPLTNTENNHYCCKRCLPNLIEFCAVPLLCVPLIDNPHNTSNPFKIEIKGFELVKNDPQILFYGYKCLKCQANNQKGFFICTYCDKEKNKWCGSCFENNSDCIKLCHTVIFEKNPFSFWSEKMSEKELNCLRILNDSVSEEDDQFLQARMYSESHQYGKAVEYYKAWIDQNEASSRDPKLAICYHHLGEIYSQQGEHQKALKDFLKSLDIRKFVYRENHPDIAQSYYNLGGVFHHQGEHQKALEYFFKSLDIRKFVYGENHTEVADSYNSLGVVYRNQGEHQKALEYYSKSLDLGKFIYGENHHHIALPYSNLGVVFYHQGNHEKALEYFFKSLDIRKYVFGENHPDVADSYYNIGVVFNDQEKYQKALEYHFKSLDIRKFIYGKNHPDIANSYNNIGIVFYDQGEHQKALEYFFKSLDIQKFVYGENHPGVAKSYFNLGLAYANQGKNQKALEYNFKSLDIRKYFYGESHSDIADSYNNIGIVYDYQKEYQHALEYHFKSLDLRKFIYGEDHPNIVDSYNNIGIVYGHQKEYQKALEYYFKSLEKMKFIYGENHPKTISLQKNISSILSNDKKKKATISIMMLKLKRPLE